MALTVEKPVQNLLSSVYGQYWPTNILGSKNDYDERNMSQSTITTRLNQIRNLQKHRLDKSKEKDNIQIISVFTDGLKNPVDPSVYRKQFKESMKPFRESLERRPYSNEREPMYVRCRPVTASMFDKPPLPPKTNLPLNKITRPMSSPPKLVRTTYDDLTRPEIYTVLDCSQISTKYGDKVGKAASEDSDEDSSDDETVPEPSVDQKRIIPKIYLRPEHIEEGDAYFSEGYRDYRKYDFDANNFLVTPFEYPYSAPQEFLTVDFHDLSLFDKHWKELTQKRPADPEGENFIDRLIELEKLQNKTVDWEQLRREKSRQAYKKRVAETKELKRLGRIRAQSARSRRDEKCCSGCLQKACSGDCALKRQSEFFCVNCRQPLCQGRCQRMTYDDHSRGRDPDSDDEAVDLRPKSCNSCQNKHTNAKTLTANLLLKGRPRSAAVTYSRGQDSLEPADLRPRSAIGMHHELIYKFDELNIDQEARPRSAKRSKLRGRAAIAPSKSIFSQRHNSLTINDPPVNVSKRRIKSAGVRRRKSSAKKRPSSSKARL